LIAFSEGGKALFHLMAHTLARLPLGKFSPQPPNAANQPRHADMGSAFFGPSMFQNPEAVY